ncbi:MAG: Glu/Leu/Phe/Val dehydrogenase [Flavobacteriales bacterium]|nr:Glu/Leu/Phe/Val dehydrogenase [Flavobacteriales bacterium]
MLSTSSKPAQAEVVLGRMEKHDHEEVLFCYDRPTGLKAIIAVHNTTLGPALGGTRMWPYASEAEALNDVLRLSRGMTYKSSLAGLDLGGGKAVIIGDSRTQKTEAMFRRFGQFVHSLNGRYITAEDVGMSVTEMVNIKKETKYVAGLPEEMGGSGDPSPVTSYGVYCGMKAAAKTAFGSDDLSGRKVSIQGAGNVGKGLVTLLVKEGASVFLTDIHDEKLAAVRAEFPTITLVKPEVIHDLDVDIHSPCALGATINDETLERLKCSVIAGAANNQLADETIHGKAVMKKGILYAPDFLINAGGIINCAWEMKGYNRKAALKQTEGIQDTALRIFKASADLDIPTYLAANQTAEHRITSIREAGLRYASPW